MTNVDRDRWHRLADLLPETAAEEVKECWETGEQEAGLRLLIEGLLASQTPVGGEDRARIAVFTEQWGQRELLAPGLLRCLGDGAPAAVRLLDGEGGEGGELLPGEGESAGLVLVPWMRCNRCGRYLLRAHRWEDWDDLSQLAVHYPIASADLGTVLRTFPADELDAAFADLLDHCPAAAV
ncbi:hypothetical protein ACIRBX_01160 [Kitasatospora sp. NPDC096147]|uniref:hypothetical protein n=1 Tax=Kitasatospora sp. NPDC096147 TaxID=3364093 RepID=UPI0038088598